MPPKTPPAETADVAVATDKEINARKAAYEAGYVAGEKKGYDDGYKAGLQSANKPKGVFEAAKREVVKIDARDEADALRQIDAIMAAVQGEFPDDKMPRSDREILLQVWRRADANKRADRNAPVAPRRSSRDPFQGPPQVEYEVVA